MIDLERELTTASEVVRSQVDRMPVRPSEDLARRGRNSRTLGGLVVLLLAVGAVGAAALLGSNGRNSFAGEPVPEQAVTYTIDLPGWTLVAVFEAEDGSGTSHTLFHDVAIENVPRRFWVDTGGIAGERANTLRDLGIESVGTVLVEGREANVYSIPSEDDAQFIERATLVYLWTAPDGEEFAFLFEGLTRTEADQILTQLQAVSRQDWRELVDSYEPTVITTVTDGS